MKYFNLTAGLLLVLSAVFNVQAQTLYTWTDDRGILHITEQPPLETDRAKDIDIIRYRQKTHQEVEAIERQKEATRREFDKIQQIQDLLRIEAQAKEARRKAQQALQQAEKKYESDQEYIRRLTSTDEKRKQFRQRVLLLNAEAEANLAQAKAALDQADEAVRKAQSAVEEAAEVP